MKDLRNLFKGAKDRYATRTSKGAFLSLLLTTCAAFTACTEKEDFNVDNNKLQVTFGVNSHGSRAINRETSLPDGSQVGARLDGYAAYGNLVYTASTGKTPQEWTGNKDVVLSDVSGTLYAFYPYDEDIDITTIPVDMTVEDQTDWLYGVPATGITDLNSEVDVTMNHALANINLSIVRDTYVGDGEISSISVQSDGIASKGTFNAAQATPAYTAFTVKGEALERSVETTLGATATDIMVIPTGTEAAITFFVTVDDVVYSVKSAPLTLEMGNSYQYTLKLNSTFMSVDGVSVIPWNNVTKEDNLELVEYNPWTGIENGVYAVSADGKPIMAEDADESCIAIALITDNQRIMIATKIGGKSYYGGSGTNLNIPDYTTENEAKLDFDGKGNSQYIKNYLSNGEQVVYSLPMGFRLNEFNKSDNSENKGYFDWYIPALGQIFEMNQNSGKINKCYKKITNDSEGILYVNNRYYWSSTERDADNAWSIYYYNNASYEMSLKVSSTYASSNCNLIFVRDCM